MEKKGTPHRKWSKEEKLRFIRLHLDEHISIKEIERKYGVGHSLVSAWVKRYLEDGEEALEPKNGNPYAALHTSGSRWNTVRQFRMLFFTPPFCVPSNVSRISAGVCAGSIVSIVFLTASCVSSGNL